MSGVESALSYQVVELGTRVASAYCGSLLASLGATVTKIEAPGGDPLRNGSPSDRAFFAYLNGGKRSLALDPNTPEGRAVLDRLVAAADLVVDGLGLADLAGHPDAVIIQISDFGSSGPYCDLPSTGLVLQAAGGWVIHRGQRRKEPVQVGGDLHEFVGGVYAACAALTALRTRARTGEAATVDVSVMEAIHATIPFHELESGDPPLFLDLASRPFPLTIVRARDGWVGLNCLTGQQWHDACAMLGVPEYADQRENLRADPDLLEALRKKVQPWFDERSAADIIELAQAFRIPAAPLGTPERLLGTPHFQERGAFLEVETEEGAFSVPRRPFRLSSTPAHLEVSVPPLEAPDGT